MTRAPCPELLVVIPMKDPAAAKTRLGPALAAAARADVAVELFRAVLRMLQALQPLSARGFAIATVTRSARIEALAREAGIAVIAEPEPPSLPAAAAAAAREAAARGHRAICLLPGDLAAPAPADLLRVLDHPIGPGTAQDAVICPSADGGTNAFLLPLPCPVRFAYGPHSFEAHLRGVRRAGLRPLALPLESLRHDVDRLEHLAALTRFRPPPASPDLHI